MTTTAPNSKLITSYESLQGMVAIVKGNIGGGKNDQTVSFAQIDSEKKKLILYERVNFKYMAVECDGPILPHEKMVKGMELGPKRPQIKLILSPQQDEYKLHMSLDQMVRAAYEFNKAKLREVFPDIETFYYHEVKVAPSRTNPEGKKAYEVLVVLKNAEVKALFEYLPEKLSSQQTEAITAAKGLVEVECVDETNQKYSTYIYTNLEPHIDQKSGKIYQDMNLIHSTYPEGIRKYRGKDHPYRPSMSDIHQWGIIIPRMIKNEAGTYSFDSNTNWVKEAGFRAVTKVGERNPFIGRVGFNVDCVMEGSGHVKVWYRCQVWLIEEKSAVLRNDFGEEAIISPTGQSIPLQSKASQAAAISKSSPLKSASNGLLGTVKEMEPDAV